LNRLTGYLFAVASSAGLGAAVALSRAAYDGGTDPLTIATLRGIAGALLLGGVCVVMGRKLTMPWTVWRHCAGLGVLMAYMFYGNIAAVQYIPVGMAALLFFIYPPLVALIMARLDRRRLSPVTALALGTSFFGLALMLGVGFEALDWRGVAFGLAAGIVCAANVSWIGRKMRGVDPLAMTFHMTLVAAFVILVFVAMFSDGLTFPVTRGGWYAASGVVFLQAVSIPIFFAAIPRIGVENTAMLNNLQPVASIALAYFLYAEILSPLQGLGGAMVIGGILLMQWWQVRRR
jgi:DME family drug/metabolite transporter